MGGTYWYYVSLPTRNSVTVILTCYSSRLMVMKSVTIQQSHRLHSVLYCQANASMYSSCPATGTVGAILNPQITSHATQVTASSTQCHLRLLLYVHRTCNLRRHPVCHHPRHGLQDQRPILPQMLSSLRMSCVTLEVLLHHRTCPQRHCLQTSEA